MPKVAVFQHIGYEILGTLNPLLKNQGLRIRYTNFDRTPEARPSLEGYSALIVLGGPMNVHQVGDYPHLEVEVSLIREALALGIPILGICLGAQLLAQALGAKVQKNPVREIGWVPIELTKAGREDPVLGCFGKREKIFQWHGDTFAIPSGAVHLARSRDCHHQAFRYGDRVYGFQFHLEVDGAMIERWLGLPMMQSELEELKQVSVESILKENGRFLERSRELSDECFSRFIGLFRPEGDSSLKLGSR